MSLGLTGQDRVAFLLPNGAELAISILAAAKAGLIAVPLSPTFAPPQLEYILKHSGARGKAVKPAMPKGGQLALSEVVVQDRFA